MTLPRSLESLSQHTDPDEFKRLVAKTLGDSLDGIQVTGSDVLLVTYIPPEKTTGGIIIPTIHKKEAIFQGKCGLLVKKGPTAFQWDANGYEWKGPVAQTGDWVMTRFGDGWDVYVKEVSCKVIDSCHVRAIVNDPSIIY